MVSVNCQSVVLTCLHYWDFTNELNSCRLTWWHSDETNQRLQQQQQGVKTTSAFSSNCWQVASYQAINFCSKWRENVPPSSQNFTHLCHARFPSLTKLSPQSKLDKITDHVAMHSARQLSEMCKFVQVWLLSNKPQCLWHTCHVPFTFLLNVCLIQGIFPDPFPLSFVYIAAPYFLSNGS